MWADPESIGESGGVLALDQKSKYILLTRTQLVEGGKLVHTLV